MKCKECRYKCKKEITFRKHILNNNEEHLCKECEANVPTFVKLLKHVPKHRYKDNVEDSNLSSDEVLDIILLKDLEEKYEFKKYSNFVFTESMLNEFLDKKEE